MSKTPTAPRRGGRRAPLSERLAGHPLGLGIAALIATAVVAYASWVVTEGVPFLQKYSLKAVLPADGPVVRKGIEVRVGGERAGKVTDVAAAAGKGRLVTMRLSKDTPIHADARAFIHVRGLAGAVYLDLALGSRGPKLASGSTIPISQTTTGEDLARVAAGFGPRARAALARTLDAYGGGLLGTGEPLNRAIEELLPLTRDGTRLLRAATPTPTALADVFGGLGRISRGFRGTQPDAMGRLIVAGDATLGALDSRREQVAATLQELAPLEDEVLRTLPAARPLLSDLSATSRTLSPGLRSLARALPAVNRLLATPARLSRVSRLTRAADPVLVAASPLLDELEPLAQVVHPVVAPLVPLATYLDPYRTDIVQSLLRAASTGANTYAEGLAGGARAIRFTPIFTCMPGRTVYPAPNTAVNERKPCR
jgi:ABC-type transporter Mla subunit MlaD